MQTATTSYLTSQLQIVSLGLHPNYKENFSKNNTTTVIKSKAPKQDKNLK